VFKQWLQKLRQPKKVSNPSIKVLIIEDSRVDAEMIKKAVDVCGFTSLVAYDGKTGVEMATVNKPNLIILDYHLPDTNGGQVLKELRSNKETSSEAVMVLSILDQPGVVVDSFTQGADQYFTKPISTSLLAEQIQAMIRHPHEV
jgi:two-component system KDP operon response regulator KdpE